MGSTRDGKYHHFFLVYNISLYSDHHQFQLPFIKLVFAKLLGAVGRL